MNHKLLISGVVLATLFSYQAANSQVKKNNEPTVGTYSQTTVIPAGILTPDKVETSIGTLKFFDGTPTEETVQLVYDNLDRSRGTDAFLKGIQGASVRELMEGPKTIGANVKFNDILILSLIHI